MNEKRPTKDRMSIFSGMNMSKRTKRVNLTLKEEIYKKLFDIKMKMMQEKGAEVLWEDVIEYILKKGGF